MIGQKATIPPFLTVELPKRLADNISSLIKSEIERAYNWGFDKGLAAGQKNLEGGIEIHGKLEWAEWTGTLEIRVDTETIEKDAKWIRKEINKSGDPDNGYEFFEKRHRVIILPEKPSPSMERDQ